MVERAGVALALDEDHLQPREVHREVWHSRGGACSARSAAACRRRRVPHQVTEVDGQVGPSTRNLPVTVASRWVIRRRLIAGCCQTGPTRSRRAGALLAAGPLCRPGPGEDALYQQLLEVTERSRCRQPRPARRTRPPAAPSLAGSSQHADVHHPACRRSCAARAGRCGYTGRCRPRWPRPPADHPVVGQGLPEEAVEPHRRAMDQMETRGGATAPSLNWSIDTPVLSNLAQHQHGSSMPGGRPSTAAPVAPTRRPRVW